MFVKKLRASGRRALRRVGIEVRRATHDRRFQTEAMFAIETLLSDMSRPVVFDVGANRGQSATKFLASFARATIHCVEPGADAAADLRRTFASDRRVHVHEVALSDAPGSLTFHPMRDDRTSSALRSGRDGARFGVEGLEPISVAATTLDALADERDVEQIDLLKLDVQGFEHTVLRGASRLLSEHRIRVVFAEVLFAQIYEGQTSFGAVSDLLTSHGYELVGLYDLAHQQGRLCWADALFVRGESDGR